MKKEQGKAKKKRSSCQLADVEEYHSIFGNTILTVSGRHSPGGILLRYFAFSIVFEEKDWYSWLLRGLLC